MTRHDLALSVVPHEHDLRALATTLAACCEEAQIEGCDPQTDAAVLLVSAQIAFVANSDVFLHGSFRKLLDHCEAHRSKPVMFDYRRH